LRPGIRRWYWALAAGLLLMAAFGILLLLRPAAISGVVGAASARIRVGMSQDEAVAMIQGSGTDGLDTYYFRGATRDGRRFSGCCGFEGLPPAAQVAWGALEVDDEYGRELVVTLGPGGVVSDVRVRSPHWWEKCYHAFCNCLRP